MTHESDCTKLDFQEERRLLWFKFGLLSATDKNFIIVVK